MSIDTSTALARFIGCLHWGNTREKVAYPRIFTLSETVDTLIVIQLTNTIAQLSTENVLHLSNSFNLQWGHIITENQGDSN